MGSFVIARFHFRTETSYDILCSCIVEFRIKDLISKDGTNLFDYKFLCDYASSKQEANGSDYSNSCDDTMKDSNYLLTIVKDMKPSSARLLRKISFQALMKVPELPCKLHDFLHGLEECCKTLPSD